MRNAAFAFLLAFLAGGAIQAATVTFVSPLPGSQAVGAQTIEITTDATAVDRVEFYVDGALAGVARKPPYRIAHDFGTSLESRRVMAKVFSNNFTKTDFGSVITSALSAGESITVDLVEVPLRVRSPRGVTAGDLRLRENKVDQTIRELRPDRGAANFVFIIDRSLSMGGGKLAEALRAVEEATMQLRSDDRLSLVLFNHNVRRAQPISRGEKLTALTRTITPSGGTSLRDALAGIPTRTRTYAIVITDGGDRNSAMSEEAALRKISGTKTTIHAIVLGARSRFLERATANTGGILRTSDRSSLGKNMRELITDINSRYLLVYQSRGSSKGWRAIDVTPRRSGIEIVSARKGYFAE
jgi:hypothetical protein